MKRLVVRTFILTALFACNNSNNTAGASESDVDAARNFIQAALDNDFEKAKGYMVNDSTNVQYLGIIKQKRAGLEKGVNQKYKDASIRIYDTRKVNDSVSIVTYSNSYMNQKDSVKAVKENKSWLIDFKYSFMHSDTSHVQ